MSQRHTIQSSSIARAYLYMCGKQVVCAVGQEERDVEKGAVESEVAHGISKAQPWAEVLVVLREALARYVGARLGIDGNDIIPMLKEELQLRLVAGGPVAQWVDGLRREALEDIVLVQCSAKLLELLRWCEIDVWLHAGQSTQEADVEGIELEDAQVVVGLQRQTWLPAEVYLIDKPRTLKPQQGILVLTRPGTGAHHLIDKLAILLGKLRGKRCPDMVYLVGLHGIGMLDEVQGIVLQNGSEYLLYALQLSVEHGRSSLGHASADAIGHKCLCQTVEEHLGQWLRRADTHEIGMKAAVACPQELREYDRIHIEMVHFAHGKRKTLMPYGDAQQGACTRHGIVGGLLEEILQRGQSFGAGLYLVEYEQRGLRTDRHVGEEGQLLDDAMRILGTLEDLGNAALFVQAEIGTMFKASGPKVPERPGLAYLTGTEKQERLAVRLCLPSLQRRDDSSFNHSGYVWKMCKPSHFTYEFCAKLHIFRTSVAMRGQKITRKRMKIRIINEKASTPICFR